MYWFHESETSTLAPPRNASATGALKPAASVDVASEERDSARTSLIWPPPPSGMKSVDADTAGNKPPEKRAFVPTPSADAQELSWPAIVITTTKYGEAVGEAVALGEMDGDAGDAEPLLLRVTLGVTDADAVTETILLRVTLGATLKEPVSLRVALSVTLGVVDAEPTNEPVLLGVTLGVTLNEPVLLGVTLGVVLGVADAEPANEPVLLGVADVLALRDLLSVAETDGEAVREALALPDVEHDNEAVRDAEPDALTLREAATEGEPLGDWQVNTPSRMM